jgi:tricorn protease
MLFALVSSLSHQAAAQSDPPLLLRFPTVSKTQIVFNYGGDLWIVPRDGGDARRLTSDVGAEILPHFSPDGSTIAFTGEYDGNHDVFTVPATGGEPRRLTYHPAEEYVMGWTPDGKKILFTSWGNSFMHFEDQLYTVPADGGFPTQLPIPIAEDASFSPDETHIAYVPHPKWQAAWKRYHGGQTTPIWILDLKDSSTVKIPRENSNDSNPMWVGDTIYFLSDRNGPVSLFEYDTKTRQVSEALHSDGLDFKGASAGPDAIVIEQFGAIKLYDLQTHQAKNVAIHVTGDIDAVRPHFAKVDPKRIQNFSISPTGARAVFEAWGDIFTVPTDKGDIRDITHSPAVADRDPAWSPDGKSIAYFSDESGEYELTIRDQNGMGPVQPHQSGQSAVVLLFTDVVARQQEDCVLRQAIAIVVSRSRQPRSQAHRRRLFRRLRPHTTQPNLVAGQQVDRLHPAVAQRTARGLCLLARSGQSRSGHRWHERRALSQLRQERQVSLLHRVD